MCRPAVGNMRTGNQKNTYNPGGMKSVIGHTTLACCKGVPVSNPCRWRPVPSKGFVSPRVDRFSKNLGDTPKLWAPEGLRWVNFLLRIQKYLAVPYKPCGPGSSVAIATRYGLDGPGIESRWGGEIFRTRPDRPWSSPSLLYNGYRVFPGGKAAGAWRWPPTRSNAEVKERVELYLYSHSGPSWPVLG